MYNSKIPQILSIAALLFATAFDARAEDRDNCGRNSKDGPYAFEYFNHDPCKSDFPYLLIKIKDGQKVPLASIGTDSGYPGGSGLMVGAEFSSQRQSTEYPQIDKDYRTEAKCDITLDFASGVQQDAVLGPMTFISSTFDWTETDLRNVIYYKPLRITAIGRDSKTFAFGELNCQMHDPSDIMQVLDPSVFEIFVVKDAGTQPKPLKRSSSTAKLWRILKESSYGGAQ